MIVITGGAGFIGSCIIAGLEAKGIRDLVVCDRLRDSNKWRNIAKRELVDIVHPDKLQTFLAAHTSSIKAIIHMGAISATTVTDADSVLENNFRLSVMLWNWCIEHQTPFIFASSAATYGNGSQGFVDDNSPEYFASLRPLNLYGWSKHLFDRTIIRHVKEGKKTPPQWVGLKFFNVYGPNEYHKKEQKSVIAHFYPTVVNGESVTLFASHHPDYANGGQLRDFIWVGDCVDVTLWFLENVKISGIFNCGSSIARSFKDLAVAIYTTLEKKIKINYTPTPESIRNNYQYFTKADITRLRASGYSKPFTSLEDGIHKYITRYLRSDDPYI